MSRLLCKVGVHTYRFKSCDPFAMCAAEICKHCGRGRIMHFAGAYQYFDAKAMETGTGKKHRVSSESAWPLRGVDGLTFAERKAKEQEQGK